MPAAAQPATDRTPSPSDPVRTGLATLALTDFRNITAARLEFSPGLNVIGGDNASGKTSLLEAIFNIGRVRSFRTNRPEEMIRYQQTSARLVGSVTTPARSAIPVGIERGAQSLVVHLDGQRLQRLSDLASAFPVQVFSADTATIFTGGPRQRRHVLDWALFHVEPRFREAWQRYTRVLKQRNAALRDQRPSAEIVLWNKEMVESSGAVDGFRRAYLAQLEPCLVEELGQLLPGMTLSLRYQSGWPAGETLAEALERGLARDQLQGYTRNGPHRADFTLRIDDHPVAAHCSRGQQKTVLLGLMLAQLRLQRQLGGHAGAFLLDDLGSELDCQHQARVLAALQQLDAQVFVTAIEPAAVDLSGWPDRRVFHVEQGRISTQ